MTRVVSTDARTTTAALTLLYGRWPPAERKLFVREALESVAKGRLDLRHLVVALDGRHEVVGAALAVERPGREAVVWTPGFQNNVATLELGLAMLTELNRRLDRAGMACAVCFVDRGQSMDRQCLEAAGFPGVADLCLLRGDPQSLLHRPIPRLPALRSISWSTDLESRFAETIAEVQRDGCDCPEVGPYRSGQDVLGSLGAWGCCCWGIIRERRNWKCFIWGLFPKRDGRGSRGRCSVTPDRSPSRVGAGH
ncbi:MAG: hypothetical protein NT069_31135 [Planctomycetota bacterium]|nr:hypothetical protein [Planctomycetota bacterium]